ncbi:hypothetical protein [Xanthomonas sp. WHRI 7945]|nr:hypothetical protein [Xanthomonas campestris pv. campestris]
MTTYWITFRLAAGSVGGRDYDTRYGALIEAVKAHRANHWWYEPTSFWLIDSDSTGAQIAASIKKAIAPAEDLALVGSMEFKNAIAVGNIAEMATLKALVPLLTTA